MSEAMVRRGGGGKKEGRYGWEKFKTAYDIQKTTYDWPNSNSTHYITVGTGFTINANAEFVLTGVTDHTIISTTNLSNKYWGVGTWLYYGNGSEGYGDTHYINCDYLTNLRKTDKSCVADDDQSKYPAGGEKDGFMYKAIVT